MNNGTYKINKAAFCGFMETADISIIGNLIKITDENNVINMTLSGQFPDNNTGNRYDSRSYVKVKTESKAIMVPNYWIIIAVSGLLLGDPKYKEWRDGRPTWGPLPKNDPRYSRTETMCGPYNEETVINHINGDASLCDLENLEIVSSAENNTHARLMKEINFYHPDLVECSLDGKGNRTYKYTRKSISCKDIEKWNNIKGNFKIQGFKDKKGEFKPRLSKEQIDLIIAFFNLKSN